MPLHVFVRFEPIADKEQQLQEELIRVVELTRSEPGCIRIHLFQSIRQPLIFCIHSEWMDEAAFDAHSKFPHMQHFLSVLPGLITQTVQAIRTTQIC